VNVRTKGGIYYPNPASVEEIKLQLLTEAARQYTEEFIKGTIITNIQLPSPELEEESEQAFTRKDREAYRETLKATAARRKAEAQGEPCSTWADV
jgi:hypothetical protein